MMRVARSALCYGRHPSSGNPIAYETKITLPPGFLVLPQRLIPGRDVGLTPNYFYSSDQDDKYDKNLEDNLRSVCFSVFCA